MRGRWLFLSLFGAFTFKGRFMAIFYEEHGLSDFQIGMMLSVSSIISVATAPPVANFADRRNCRAKVLAVCALMTAVIFAVQLLALPQLGIMSQGQRFPTLFALRIVQSFFSAPLYPLTTALTIGKLREEHGDKGHERFGEERLYGAVGWAVCNLLLGALLDAPGVGVWIMHLGLAVFTGIFLLVLREFATDAKGSDRLLAVDAPASMVVVSVDDGGVGDGGDGGDGGNESSNESDGSDGSSESDDGGAEDLEGAAGARGGTSTLGTLRTVCGRGGGSTVCYFALIFVLYMCTSLVENLLFLFFKDDLRASNLLCGISVVITVIFEIPLFARAPQLLRALGPSVLTFIATASYAVRTVAYTLVQNRWYVLLCEPLHGVTYSAAHTASVAFVAERTPPHLEASAQSLLQALGALGTSSGTVLGGYILDERGATFLYRGAAVVIMSATLAFAMVEHIEKKDREVLKRDYELVSTKDLSRV